MVLISGIRLAQELKGEIISADSMQVYKGLDKGTAKVTPEETQGIPHHLIDIREPWEAFSVAQFQQLAQEKIKEIEDRQRLPILLGGTGLYVNGVINDYHFTPTPEANRIREELWEVVNKEGTEDLHQRLRALDPISAEKIHSNDAKRIIRALEVYYTTGQPISSFASIEGSDKYQLTIVGLNMDRELLYQRIDRRVELMLENGWLEEVQGLLARGVPPESQGMQGLGYKQLVMYLNNQLSYQEAIELIKRDTRRYGKRQITWFKRDPRTFWVDVTNKDENQILLEILPHICRSIESDVE